jgi:SAM-dependent methyltransferase
MTDLPKYSHLDEHRQMAKQNRYAARKILDILDRFLTIDSVLDLGCGIGVWMESALVKPGRAVLGVEFEEFAPHELAVDSKMIVNATLDQPIDLQRRFDLALCLEVAEHIEPEGAACVVSNCVRHSDVVLFSAAIPGQGGLHHVNEQPPEYWQGLFDQDGYDVVDIIRPLIWRDDGVPVWYRQNMLLFLNRKASSTLDFLRAKASEMSIPLHRAHPDLVYWRSLEVQREMARHHAELGEARREMARLEAECGQSLAALERALLQAEQDKLALRQAFLSSSSWRVTAPLRALGEVMLRLKRRGRR